MEGLASTSYVDEKVAAIKVPTKVSELENDAGYITADNIPDTSNFITIEALDGISTTINNITEQVQNIEVNYVTKNALENYTTTEELAANYITTAEATAEIERIVEKTVQEAVTPNSLNYETF